MALVQRGAALTDWLTAVVFFWAAGSLGWNGRNSPRKLPRWYLAYMAACLCGGFSCSAGGFMWGWGINMHALDMTLLETFFCDACVLGMFGEALALVSVWRGFRPSVGKASFSAVAALSALVVVATGVWMAYGHWAGLSISLLMAPAAAMGPALLFLALLAASHAFGEKKGTATKQAQDAWMLIFVGTMLNLIGAVVLGALDNDCTGMFCMSETLPWESSPCRWNIEPRGSSCPLPEDFNHGAVMHIFAITGSVTSAAGVKGLLNCGWDHDAAPSEKSK